MKNQYNFVAPFYRLISTIVFGNTILDAQKSLIKKLPQEGNLLVIGGGNGDILPFIFDHAPRLNIMYVEASTTMISLAKKKAGHNPLVHFHHSDDFTYPIFSSDYVLAPFVLDLFSPEKIIEIISKIDNSTGTSPAWYICDFDSQKVQHATIYQKIKIKLTILFFRVFTKHPLNHLPDIFSVFKTLGYRPKAISKSDFDLINYEVFEK